MDRSNKGQVVFTIGYVDLDLEDQSVAFNCGTRRILPPGYKMILKHVDDNGFAFIYRSDDGVMKFPASLLELAP